MPFLLVNLTAVYEDLYSSVSATMMTWSFRHFLKAE